LQAARHDDDGSAATLRELDAMNLHPPRGCGAAGTWPGPCPAASAAAPGSAAPLAAAGAALVRAALARASGPQRRADQLATEAAAQLPASAPDALRWRLLSLHARIKQDRAEFDESLRLQHLALALADRLGEPWRRCETRTSLAYALLLAGQTEAGERALAQSLALARDADDDVALSRALNVVSFFRDEAGDAAGELAAMQQAIAHARRGGARQDEVLGLANLADHYLKRGDFDTALKLSQEALPLTRALGDRTGESVALANIGLALISLRRPEEGLRYTSEAMALDRRAGALDSMARFELELGHYLERAGYLREAVAAYQRQRKLADEVSRLDQQQAILELQEGQDHEHRQRELELLQREGDLQQARLLNQTLTQRLWAAAALAALLGMAVAALLLRRLRRHNAALKAGNARLLSISEQDVLTGLANRHHLQRLRQRAPGGPEASFEGALLLIDIDHFKRINDRLGHAAGDAVLVELARRLRAALRESDLIVRWGGEEFLVIAQALSQDQLQELAQRLLCAVAEPPVALDGQAIEVTASIGHASFPTQPTGLAVPWERALALVDTALYLAKAHGRNLAYGVQQLHARDQAELAQISRGLEAAWHEGRVQLTAARGPAAPTPTPTDARWPAEVVG
jgi:diguanylate cyclase (GGDEF)-like protein